MFTIEKAYYPLQSLDACLLRENGIWIWIPLRGLRPPRTFQANVGRSVQRINAIQTTIVQWRSPASLVPEAEVGVSDFTSISPHLSHKRHQSLTLFNAACLLRDSLQTLIDSGRVIMAIARKLLLAYESRETEHNAHVPLSVMAEGLRW